MIAGTADQFRIVLTGIGLAAPNGNSLREFRENLEWAAVVPGEGEMSPAVTQLLNELMARGIAIHRY